ncbi:MULTISPECIES: class I SAM-dependent methyltransferase [Acidiphilium]|uniref:Methyltransferase domain-containing protein n=1 Tax=Acidiphilium rubrum TaxID=526 RepID=A0A8G2FLC3_ACIRU|nr:MULTISPECIES: class I SAM-dependent methyltransferase [Acidiphilium]SIQ61615.1 hypothetical protein SAMN05421828_1075 [Acidiphilium rubrum]
MDVDLSLNEIGLKNGTDKSSSYHNYLNFYEQYFSKIRSRKLNILEIGVLDGASLRTWEEYFSNSTIVGADIVPSAKFHEAGRIKIELLDQSNIEELTRLAVKYGPFDLIIEDGSHMWEHQITSLRTLFPFLKSSGIYIVEDLQTNYGDMYKLYKGISALSCVDYLKKWVDLRVGDDLVDIDSVEDAFLRTYGRAAESITFYRRACLIKKLFIPIIRESQPFFDIPQPTSSVQKTLKIAAHISNQGDVLGNDGFVNFSSENFPIQGFSIELDERLIHYRVQYSDSTWSDWFDQGMFAGTRGESRELIGFTCRLLESEKTRWSIRTVGKFVGTNQQVIAGDGEDCRSPSGGALIAMHVAVFSNEE